MLPICVFVGMREDRRREKEVCTDRQTKGQIKIQKKTQKIQKKQAERQNNR